MCCLNGVCECRVCFSLESLVARCVLGTTQNYFQRWFNAGIAFEHPNNRAGSVWMLNWVTTLPTLPGYARCQSIEPRQHRSKRSVVRRRPCAVPCQWDIVEVCPLSRQWIVQRASAVWPFNRSDHHRRSSGGILVTVFKRACVCVIRRFLASPVYWPAHCIIGGSLLGTTIPNESSV